LVHAGFFIRIKIAPKVKIKLVTCVSEVCVRGTGYLTHLCQGDKGDGVPGTLEGDMCQGDGGVDTFEGSCMLNSNKNTAVLGMGNPLMGDDAFGSFVIQELKKQPEINADLIDAGTDSAAVLDVFLKYRYVILIDAVDFKAKPGSLCRISFHDLQKMQQDLTLSLHNINPVSVLKLAGHVKQRSSKTKKATSGGYLLGIQPKNIGPGFGLSPDVEKALPRAVDIIIRSLTTEDLR